MMWYIVGVLFIISSFVGLVQYGFLNFALCVITGVILIAVGKSKRAEEKESAQNPSIKVLSSSTYQPGHEKSFTFPIVGVTFKNDDCSDRQHLLRKIYFKDAPFNNEQNVVLERYLWKDEPAYYVKVNDYIVGNIGADDVWYFEKNTEREYKIDYIEVYGGGKGKNYGAKIHGTFLDTI